MGCINTKELEVNCPVDSKKLAPQLAPIKYEPQIYDE